MNLSESEQEIHNSIHHSDVQKCKKNTLSASDEKH